MYWVILLGSVAIGLVVLELVVQLVLVRLIVPWFENGPPFQVPDSDEDHRAERFEFETDDGLTLQGSLYHHLDQTPRGLIVFCHEFTGSQWTAMAYCEGLYQSGFDILAFDFRNHGSSDSQHNYVPLHWLSDHEMTDVQAAIQYAADRPELAGLPIGLFGVSRGGAAALVAAARNPAIEAVASDGGYGTNTLMEFHTPRWALLVVPAWIYKLIPWWHSLLTLAMVRWWSQKRRGVTLTHVERWLPRLASRDVLLVSGGSDNYVVPQVTHTLQSLIGGDSPEPCIVPRAKHNRARSVQTIEYDQRLVDFFGDMPGAEVTETVVERLHEQTPVVVD